MGEGWGIIRRCKTSNLRIQRMLKLATLIPIVVVGLIHLIGAPQHFRVASYVGLGFVADFMGGFVAAGGICQDALWGVTGCLGRRRGAGHVLGEPLGRLTRFRTRGRQVWTIGNPSLVVEALFNPHFFYGYPPDENRQYAWNLSTRN
jgi:hypothetical protein